MRTRILVGTYEMEFCGSARYWNRCLRPIFGGPEAKETAVAEDTPTNRETPVDERSAPEEDPATVKPATPAAKRPPAHRPEPAPAAPAETPATDTDLLYEDLAKAGGRRAEKDAILATVWLLGGTQRDVGFDEVARRLRTVQLFREVRVKPHLLKHCSRSHMLEPGAERETVRMTKKGVRYIAGLMG